jgi:uncharacterized protein DUF6457
MRAEEWIERFAAEDFARVLELASVAAHSSERMAAPLACWLAGVTGRPLSELTEIAEGIGEPE